MKKYYNPDNRAWHEIDEAYESETGCTVHSALFEHVRGLEDAQSGIHFQNVLNTRLYSNREPLVLSWHGDSGSTFHPVSKNYENIIQSSVDTLLSRLTGSKPKATVYTRGAEFGTYLQGRQLDKFLWGEFVGLDIHRKVRRVVLDALVCGSGFLKIDLDGDELCVERINPDDIIVDQRECLNGTVPRQVCYRTLISRSQLKQMYAVGKKKTEIAQMIDEAPAHNFNYVSARAPSDEQVLVIEAIKRKDSTPGCKVISIENCVLYSEEYNEDDFPYVVFRWAEPLQGFYGRSAVTDSLGYQIRQNQLNENIWWGQNVACVPRLLVEQGSGIQPHKLTNEIGQVITYRGTPPMQLEWRAFPTELYNERERNKQACLSNLGLNERMTSGGMPSQFRADSSEAIRELNATDDDRFNDKVQEIEQVYIKVARKIVKAAAKLYRNKKVDRTTVYRSGQLVKQIKWSEVDEVGDKYVLQIAASSTLNMTPSARKDLLSKWADQGKITQGQYHHWVEAPDLERIDELNGASCAHIEYMTDKMLNGDWVSPDPHDDLGYGIPQVVKTYLYLRTLDCPEKILRLFRNWLVIAENLVNPEEAIPPPPPGMAPPMPMPGDQGTIPPGPGMDFPQAQSPMPMGAAPPVPMPQPPGVM